MWYCMRTPANSHERINNEQECIYLCWPQSNASPSANDMSTKLYLNTLCRGFCTSVLLIHYHSSTVHVLTILICSPCYNCWVAKQLCLATGPSVMPTLYRIIPMDIGIRNLMIILYNYTLA